MRNVPSSHGALTNAVLVADGLLEVCRHLTKALEWKTPPTDQQIADACSYREVDLREIMPAC